MPTNHEQPELHRQHTREAIAERLSSATEHSYLGDMMLGAVDGAVTTFAIVCGVVGAGLNTGVALVLGLANVLADGFSMAAGNFLSTKSQHELVDRIRRTEELHIEEHPEGEREEIRQIFESKGFSGEMLESITDTITSENQRWIDTMITDEFGLQLIPPQPLKAAGATFSSFLVAGMIPLLPLFASDFLSPDQIFLTSSGATGVSFCLIGGLKGYATHRSTFLSALETLLIGGSAAMLAYAVGAWLKSFAVT